MTRPSTNSSAVDAVTECAASSRLYAANAFRVLGLRVDVSAREIGRQADHLAVQLKFGDREPKGWHAFLGEVGPTVVPTATESLGDPERRLLEEAFWIWPLATDGSADAGLEALERGDTGRALEIWGEAQCEVSAHNLAVYNHAVAVSLDKRTAGRPLSAAEVLRRDSAWESALAWWVEVLDGEVLEQRLSVRAAQLDDPRATRSLAKNVAAAIERIVIAAAVAPAVAAADRGDTPGAVRHMRIVRSSDLDDKLVSEEVRKRTLPKCSRVGELCEAAAETDKETQGLEAARRLLDETRPLLEQIDAFFDSSNLVRSDAHDRVANAASDCLIRYAIATKDWAGTEVLFRALPEIASGTEIRRRLEEDIADLRELVAGAAAEEAATVARSTCWFCDKRLERGSGPLEVPLFRNVRVNQLENAVETTWEKSSVVVPRCQKCATAHASEKYSTQLGGKVGVALGIAAAVGLGFAGMLAWAVVEFLLVVYAGVAVGRHLARRRWPAGTRPELHYVHFAPLARITSEGWEIDARLGATVASGRGPFARLSAYPVQVAISSAVIAFLGLVPLGASTLREPSGLLPAAPTSRPAKSSPSAPARVPKPPAPAASTRSSSTVESAEVSRLRSRLDAERSRLTKEGTELAAMGADLTNFTSQISALETTLQRYARDRAAGVYVDGDAIKSAQSQLNALVAKHKSLLRKKDALQASHSQAIALFNIDVEEYNRLTKR